MTGVGDFDLLRPGDAAERLGVAPRTLANWADAGIINAVITVGGHRRYRAVDLDNMIKREPLTEAIEASPQPDPTLGDSRPIGRGRGRGSYARRGRRLTEAEVAKLSAAPTVQRWAELAAELQADGSSIRQIASATGTLPATVAARISRNTRPS